MKKEKQFVVYKTIYNGTKLPRYYIGSTTLKRASSGKYFGSVKSKKYKAIFKKELLENRNLFSLKILSYHTTRSEALNEELRLQVKYNVVKSPEYFNESLAKKNGYFGRIIKGEAHPNYGNNKRTGTKHSEETKRKISLAHIGMQYGQETKNKLSELAKQRWKAGKGNPPPVTKSGSENPMFGKKQSKKTKNKISLALKGKNNNPKTYIVQKNSISGIILETYKGFGEAERINNITRGKLSYNYTRYGNNFKCENFIWSVISNHHGV